MKRIAALLLALALFGCSAASQPRVGGTPNTFPVTMRPPTGLHPQQVFDTIGNVIRPNANGTFTLTDQRAIYALVSSGWQTLYSPQVTVTLSSLTPSATAGAYGLPTVVAPVSGYQALDIRGIDFDMTAGGAETLTCQATVTYADNTTAAVSEFHAFAGAGSFDMPFTLNQLMGLYTTNEYATKVSYACQSSINNSTATIAFTAVEISQ